MALAGPTQQALQTKGKVTHLYFHRLNRTNLLRVHWPEEHDDLIDRRTLLEAEKRETSWPASNAAAPEHSF
jgi:hypothetical protein